MNDAQRLNYDTLIDLFPNEMAKPGFRNFVTAFCVAAGEPKSAYKRLKGLVETTEWKQYGTQSLQNKIEAKQVRANRLLLSNDYATFRLYMNSIVELRIILHQMRLMSFS